MSPAAGFGALRDGAALGTVAPRRMVAVHGSDRASYLHGLLTNDIEALRPGSGCYAAWLTPQGRMVTDMHVLALQDTILLDLPAAQADALRDRLDQFLFAEDEQLESLDDRLRAVWIHGPAAPALVDRTVAEVEDAASWPMYAVRHGKVGTDPVTVARIDQLGVPGYALLAAPEHAAAVEAALRAGGAVDVPAEAIELARIEAGYPLFGIDMTENTIPLEAGIERRAISFTKGCYVGQEVIIRVLHRGHGRVARRLVGVRFEHGPPAPRAGLFSGDREIGVVTSAAARPGGGGVGLGYVQRDFVQAGTAVEVQDGGARMPAVVTGPVAAPAPASADE